MITVDQLKLKSPIYVLNKSNGDFLLTLYDKAGNSELIPIPKTFIPVLITGFAAPEKFVESSAFRQAVSKGVLEIIPEEEAFKQLEGKFARLEQDRLRKVLSNLNPERDDTLSSLEVIKEVGDKNVNIRIKDIIMRSDITENEKHALLVGEEKSVGLKKEDYEFIVLTIEEDSPIAKWASKKLDKLF